MTPERARARVADAAGPELLERLDHLEALRAGGERAEEARPPAPQAGEVLDADVIVMGGGLWLLVAPLLAARGLRTVVLERARAGQSHREWNASGPELRALVRAGLLDEATLARLVIARYDRGICRFDGGATHPVTDVLDHAVDAGALLEHARAACEARGVRILDEHTVLSHSTSRDGARARGPGGTIELSALVLVDARGAASPFASADLVCPTVGGVLGGLAEGDGPDVVDPRVGEILATVDGIDAGRQHVWEAFPGRPGETTVYLFYYAHASERTSLAELYARFFDTLSTFKRGDARLLRPTFGFIPGWSRLTPAPRSGDPRIVLVGDAAARHSPLTYCGFGATLRSLERCADAVLERVTGVPAREACAVDDAPIHALTGILAHVMASRAFGGDELNRLLDAAFASLGELGDDVYGALLRDEMRPRDFTRFLRRTASRHPQVWGEVMRGLGPWTLGRWSLGVARRALGGSA